MDWKQMCGMLFQDHKTVVIRSEGPNHLGFSLKKIYF